MFEVIGWVFIQCVLGFAFCWLVLGIYVVTGFGGWRNEYFIGLILAAGIACGVYKMFEHAPFTIEHKPLYTQEQ